MVHRAARAHRVRPLPSRISLLLATALAVAASGPAGCDDAPPEPEPEEVQPGQLEGAWAITLDGAPVSSCAEVGATWVKFEAEHTGGFGSFFESFRCDNFSGRTVPLDAGTYTVKVALLDANEQKLREVVHPQVRVTDGATALGLSTFAFQSQPPPAAGGIVTLVANPRSLELTTATAAFGLPQAELDQLATFAEAYVTGVPLGTCGTFPPPAPPAGVGTGLDLGATVLLDTPGADLVLDRLPNQTYASSMSVAATQFNAGATMDFAAPSSPTGLTPNPLVGLVVLSPRPQITMPVPDTVVTPGEPLLVTWAPFAANALMIYAAGGVGCRADPAAGSFTIPGATTMLMSGFALNFAATNRRTAPATFGGATRSVRGYGLWFETVRVTFRTGGG